MSRLKKYLITGFSGFVSKHFLEYLSSVGERCEVVGISRSQAEPIHYDHLQIRTYQVDLKDAQLVREIISSVKPDYIIHLASESSVAYSWQNPLESFQNNTNIFLNLVESVRVSNLKCRILSVGSSEEYGIVDPATLPLTEKHEFNPISPYAVARVSQELLSKIYINGFGLDIIMTRSFNHIGPRQRDTFVISSFAKQLAKIKKYNKPAEIIAGNLSFIRDFLDVRDIVKAYYQLLQRGIKGEVYNICSGRGTTLESIIQIMASILKTQIITIIDPDLIRPSDNAIIIGSNAKIVESIGWKPIYKLEQSLEDIINYWIENV